MVNSPLIRPYFLGVNVAFGGGVPLDFYDLTCRGWLTSFLTPNLVLWCQPGNAAKVRLSWDDQVTTLFEGEPRPIKKRG